MTFDLKPFAYEPAADVAARATRKMMEAAGLQTADKLALDPEATAPMIGALLILNLGLASFMVDAGIKMDAIRPRLDQIAGAIRWGHSPRVLENLALVTQALRELAPDHLKE